LTASALEPRRRPLTIWQFFGVNLTYFDSLSTLDE
jgi:hypothetical protein